MRVALLLSTMIVGLAAACTAPVGAPQTEEAAAGEQALQRFEVLSREDAREAYAVMDVAERSLLWRAQIERTLREPWPSDAQRALLEEIHADMEAALTTRAAELEAKVLAVSSEAEADALIGTLGDPALRAPSHEGRKALPDCTSNWTCYSGCTCDSNYGYCSVWACSSSCTEVGGCGFLNLGTCTGITHDTGNLC